MGSAANTSVGDGYILEKDGNMIPIDRFKEASNTPNKIAYDVIKVQVKDHFDALQEGEEADFE